MSEDELKVTETAEDTEALLPDGWTEKDDIFDPEAWSGKANTDQEKEPAAEKAEQSEAPTTDTEDSDADQSAGDGADTDTSGQTSPAAEPPLKTYRLKVNHEEKDVQLSDDEIVARLQKSYAYDDLRERQDKEKYRTVYQDQIDKGMTEELAKLAASNSIGGKEYDLTDEEEPQKTTVPQSTLDLRNEIESIYTLFPSERGKQVPDEVATAMSNGESLTKAYLKYMGAKDQAAVKSLKKENEVLKQNAASAAKAPIKGVTGGGPTGTKKEDPFLKGFQDTSW